MRKLFILFFCLWFLNCSIQHARAQAAPVSIVQNALGGSFRNFLVKRGFAANDPRFGATFAGVSSTLATWASGAVALAAGALSAPAWLTAAFVVLGVPLAMAAGESAAKWLWDKNNPTKVKVTYPARADETPSFAAGDNTWAIYAGGKVYARGSDPQSTAAQFAGMLGEGWQLPDRCTRANTNLYHCTAYKWDAIKQRWDGQQSISVYYEAGSPVGCPASHYANLSGNCVPNAMVTPANNGLAQDIQTAVNTIPGLDMASAVNPEVLASTLNKAWQETAAKPGYTGLPYDYTNPVTAADISTWAAQNPDIYPKVSDWVKPQDPVNKPWTLPNTTAPVTSYDPGANTNTGTNPAGASQAQVNLGPDPGIPAPQMEETPTAQAILKPILDLLPDLKNFNAQAAGGECPKPSFEAFETTFRLEKHCDLAEQNRGAIRAGMMVVFALASLMIVLKA